MVAHPPRGEQSATLIRYSLGNLSPEFHKRMRRFDRTGELNRRFHVTNRG
jgi:hypothetical protein